jgi:hypothetical protein
MINAGREKTVKCPRCKYISFDYNERCPKCDNDLSRERKAFDLINFKHNPPHLLNSLTGDFGDTDRGLDRADWSVETDTNPEDLDMHLDTEELSEGLPEQGFSLDLADLEDETVDSEGSAPEELDSADISLDDLALDLPPDQDLIPQGSSEVATVEIAPENLHYSEDQEK